nr:DUF6362 family protein [uncultured Rhodopila sp.]
MRDATHAPVDAAYVLGRLEEAGATLLTIPGTGHSPRMYIGGLDCVHSAIEAYGWTEVAIRPAAPSPRHIDEMDEALTWLQLIPNARHVLRRIVGARMLVHPVTGRHLFSWRRVGRMIGADHKAAERWHAQGIDVIALNLRAQNYLI